MGNWLHIGVWLSWNNLSDGNRERMHSYSQRDHYAVRGLSRLSGPWQVLGLVDGSCGSFGLRLGSIVAYWAGKYGGRPFVEKYGKYVLVRRKDLDKADLWFKKHGDRAVLISRLLPVIRTFISFPAGIARVRFGRFIVYTFLGSLPWCLALAYAGKVLGEKWDTELKKYFHGADAIIGIVLLILMGLYIYHHIKSDREYVGIENKAK